LKKNNIKFYEIKGELVKIGRAAILNVKNLCNGVGTIYFSSKSESYVSLLVAEKKPLLKSEGLSVIDGISVIEVPEKDVNTAIQEHWVFKKGVTKDLAFYI
jgi:hypothetical protein